MQERKMTKTKQKKTKKTILKLFLAVAVILILSVFFIVPALLSSEAGRKKILAKINSAIDGRTDFSSLSMGWFKGIKVKDFVFNDRDGQISVHVRQIDTKPHYASIMAGGLSFGQTIIDEPKIEINLKKKPENTNRAPSTPKKSDSDMVGLPIKKIDLIVKNGSLKIANPQKASVEVSQINSRLNLRPPGKKTEFNIDMSVADKAKSSKIHAEGQIKSKKSKGGWKLIDTSGDLNVEIKDLNLESLEPFLALAGIQIQAKGRLTADIKTKIKDGNFESLNADIKAKNLDITGEQFKGDRLKSSFLDITIGLGSNKKTINIDKLNIKSDWAQADITGVVPVTFESLADFVQADSDYNLRGSFNCDLAQILSQMPNTFAVKQGLKVTSGQLSGKVETSARLGKRLISGQANIVGLAGVVEGKSISVSEPIKAVVEITSDKRGIRYDKLNLSSAFAQVNCTGSSKLLNYQAEVDLAKLQAELGQFVDTGSYLVAGEVSIQGKVATDTDKINIAGSSKYNNIRISSTIKPSVFEPTADIAFDLNVDRKKAVVNVDFVNIGASFGRIDIKDTVVPMGKDSKELLKLNLTAKTVDLAKLIPYAIMFSDLPKEMQLAGIADSALSITAKNNTYRISTDATRVKNLKFSLPGKKPFESKIVSLVSDIELNPVEKTYKINELELITENIKSVLAPVSLITKNGQTKLKGQASIEYDWSAVSTAVANFLPSGLTMHGKRKTEVSFSSQYPEDKEEKLLANLNTTIKSLGFDRAQYMGMTFGPTEVPLKFQKGLMTIGSFSSKVNKGQLTFAGNADFNQEPTLLKTPYPIQMVKDVQINEEMSRKLLAYINPIFANAVSVTGVANFECESLAIPLAGADKNALEVIGTIAMKAQLQNSNLLGTVLQVIGKSARNNTITIHPTKFILQKGYLRYDDMQIDIDGNPFNFKGVIGLDNSLDMRLTLPVTLDGRMVKVGEESSERRITLPLTGTIDKPKIDLSRVIQEQGKEFLEKEVEKLLKKGLEGLFK